MDRAKRIANDSLAISRAAAKGDWQTVATLASRLAAGARVDVAPPRWLKAKGYTESDWNAAVSKAEEKGLLKNGKEFGTVVAIMKRMKAKTNPPTEPTAAPEPVLAFEDDEDWDDEDWDDEEEDGEDETSERRDALKAFCDKYQELDWDWNNKHDSDIVSPIATDETLAKYPELESEMEKLAESMDGLEVANSDGYPYFIFTYDYML